LGYEGEKRLMFPHPVMLYGTTDALPVTQTVQAGPLTALFENGDLRYIRLGEHEIIRRIYAAVRDHNWFTVLPVLSNLQVEQGAASFHIRYDVEHRKDDIHFIWQGEITGAADGTLTFAMRGEALSTFRRNRVGFCILHPVECAGAKARVEHVDGSTHETVFPSIIAPQQIVDGLIKPVAPFEEMRVLSHEVIPGVWADLRMEGDTFELEDQRNWLDASYKTYCTPLRLPFPVEVPQGTRIEQTLTLRIRGAGAASHAAAGDDAVRLSLPATAGRLPALGVETASHGLPLTAGELDRLKRLDLTHLRLHLDMAAEWEPQLRRAAGEAAALGLPLELALKLRAGQEAADLQAAAELVKQLGAAVARLIVLHTNELTTSVEWVRLAGQRFPGVPIISGTDANFCELNRARAALPELAAALDGLTFSANPQVHAFDNASLVETLLTLPSAAETARAIAGEKPLSISPITFKMRWNPYATAAPAPTPPGVLPREADVRQMSLFGAAWTLGCIAALVKSGIDTATFYETTGWQGVMETQSGSPEVQPRFYSTPGMTFPLYHVLADVGAFAGGAAHSLVSNHPLRACGLLLQQAGQSRWLIANLTATEQTISLPPMPTHAHLRLLDESTFASATGEAAAFRESSQPVPGGATRLALKAYAVACIDA
jgi:hypothetical protein